MQTALRHVSKLSMKKEEKRNPSKKIFLYFCTQKVKEKRGKSKPQKRKSAEKRKSHMPDHFKFSLVIIRYHLTPQGQTGT